MAAAGAAAAAAGAAVAAASAGAAAAFEALDATMALAAANASNPGNRKRKCQPDDGGATKQQRASAVGAAQAGVAGVVAAGRVRKPSLKVQEKA